MQLRALGGPHLIIDTATLTPDERIALVERQMNA